MPSTKLTKVNYTVPRPLYIFPLPAGCDQVQLNTRSRSIPRPKVDARAVVDYKKARIAAGTYGSRLRECVNADELEPEPKPKSEAELGALTA